MRIVIIGCEYSGTSTLVSGVYNWNHEVMDEGFTIVHDHWKIPETWGHPEGSTKLKGMTDEEREQVRALSPRLKEMTQRQSLYYHIFPHKDPDHQFLMVGLHIEDAIYAPLYFDYGIQGDFDVDRSLVMRIVEEDLLRFRPDTTLLLLKARPEVIARRMREAPHDPSVLQEKDIDYVLDRFEAEFETSRMQNKIVIDNSNSTPEETLAECITRYEPFLSQADKVSILVKKAKQRGDWL